MTTRIDASKTKKMRRMAEDLNISYSDFVSRIFDFYEDNLGNKGVKETSVTDSSDFDLFTEKIDALDEKIDELDKKISAVKTVVDWGRMADDRNYYAIVAAYSGSTVTELNYQKTKALTDSGLSKDMSEKFISLIKQDREKAFNQKKSTDQKIQNNINKGTDR